MLDKQNYTKMIQEYLDIKNQHKDKIVLYRLGDFYEFFFEDAIEASKKLDLTLTSRFGGSKTKIPMCGFPANKSSFYIEKLVSLGKKVLVIEQNEQIVNNKKVINRTVDRIITLANIENEGIINNDNCNTYFILTVSFIKDKNFYNIVYGDISLGKFFKIKNIKDINLVLEYVNIISPVQLIFLKSDYLWVNSIFKEIKNVDYVDDDDDEPIDGFNINFDEDKYPELNTVLKFLKKINTKTFDSFQSIEDISLDNYLFLNKSAISSLEIFPNSNNNSKNMCLFNFINKTQTVLGSRKLKEWIGRPLYNSTNIQKRLDAVDFFYKNPSICLEIINFLKHIFDLQRIVGRILNRRDKVKDIFNLYFSLVNVKNVLYILDAKCNYLYFCENIKDLYSSCLKIISLLEGRIDFNKELNNDTIFIKYGFSQEFDYIREIIEKNDIWIRDYEYLQQCETEISNLKIKYNRIYGYFIEVTKQYTHLLKENDKYIHRQTLSNCSRYVTEELKKRESDILEANNKIYSLQKQIYDELVQEVSMFKEELYDICSLIGKLDVLINFSKLSLKNKYVRASISEDNSLELRGSRHPIVEISSTSFVENDIKFTNNEIFLITGPNMGGKSTFMRQVALAVIMNQIGCYVPASYAKLPLFDAIFTRIGAQDSIVDGDSTFMVEMKDVSQSICGATSNSLLIYDEIGRGTATYDGIAISCAIIRYISEKLKCKTFFSTHYHELIYLTKNIKNLRNIFVSAEIIKNSILFHYKLKEGSAKKSYGLHVAKLANLPESITDHAFQILNQLEKNYLKDQQIDSETYLGEKYIKHANLEKKYLNLLNIITDIKSIDLNSTTPLNVVNKLNSIMNTIFKVEEINKDE